MEGKRERRKGEEKKEGKKKGKIRTFLSITW